jgi:hypothetical protein
VVGLVSSSCRKKYRYDKDAAVDRLVELDTKLEELKKEKLMSGHCFCLMDSPETCAKVVKLFE